MATSAELLCNICEGQNIRKLAEHWCPECDEGLCSVCKIHHDISKLTKSHGDISIENYKKLPQNILSISHHCKEHGKVFTNYCQDHECLCCPVCIANTHNYCKHISHIDDIVKTAKSSSLLESIQESIGALQHQLRQITTQQDEKLVHNQQQREHFIAEIKKFRKSIDDHFDKLERTITLEISAAEERVKLDIAKFSDQLKEKQKTLETLEVDISSVKQYASDLQTCLGCMTFKTKVEGIEKYLTSLKEKGKFKKICIKHNFNENIADITTAFKRFGTVTVDEFPLEFDLVHNRQRAQIISRPIVPVSKSINDIKVTLNSKWEVPNDKNQLSITGCTMQPDGKVIIVDRGNNHRVLIFTKDWKLEKEIQFPSGSYPNDVTSVDDRTICVSFGNKRLEMINNVTYKTSQVIKTSHPCCGVTSHNGNLIWYEQWKGIQIKDKASNTSTTLVKDESGDYWSYLTVHEDRVYQTIRDKYTVIYYSIKGEKLWEFKDDTVIRRLTGITIDNNSNIYVASLDNKVVILSRDGKDLRQLLGKEDGIDNLYGIYFDKSRSCLLVANEREKVFIYNLF